MKIAVCIKRVPVMEVKFVIAADGTRVEEAGLKYDVNDFDLWAVEAALQLKEKANAGEVVVISLHLKKLRCETLNVSQNIMQMR